MKKGSNSIGSILFVLLFVIALVVLYTFILAESNIILECVALGIAGFLFLVHFLIMIKNKQGMKQSKKIMVQKDGYQGNNSLLESYVVFSIWNHQKCVMTKKQIYLLLQREIELKHLIYDKETLRISPKWHLEDMDISTKFFLEAILLDSFSFQQNAETKLQKLEKYKQEKKRVPMIDVEDNITKNLVLTSSVKKLIQDVKKQYFEEYENTLGGSFSIISYFLILLNLVMAFTFMKNPTVTNFYLPIVVSLLLGIVVTSKYQEKIIVCSEKLEEVANILTCMEKEKEFLKQDGESTFEFSEIVNSDDNS